MSLFKVLLSSSSSLPAFFSAQGKRWSKCTVAGSFPIPSLFVAICFVDAKRSWHLRWLHAPVYFGGKHGSGEKALSLAFFPALLW